MTVWNVWLPPAKHGVFDGKSLIAALSVPRTNIILGVSSVPRSGKNPVLAEQIPFLLMK